MKKTISIIIAAAMMLLAVPQASAQPGGTQGILPAPSFAKAINPAADNTDFVQAPHAVLVAAKSGDYAELMKSGDKYLNRRHYSKARELYYEALKLAEKKHGRVHSKVALILFKLGSAYLGDHKRSKALRRLKRAAEIYFSLSEKSFAAGKTNELLGGIEISQGNHGSGEFHYYAALSIYAAIGDRGNAAKVQKTLWQHAMKRALRNRRR